jgi:hypothetical protein
MLSPKVPLPLVSQLALLVLKKSTTFFVVDQLHAEFAVIDGCECLIALFGELNAVDVLCSHA